MAPRLSAHRNAIYLQCEIVCARSTPSGAVASMPGSDAGIRARCWNAITWISCGRAPSFRRTSATRLDAIDQRLAALATEFSQNVLADEEDYIEPLNEAQVAGVPASLRDAVAATARERGLDAPYAVTLSRSSVEPFLQFADDRALREKLFKAWVGARRQ